MEKRNTDAQGRPDRGFTLIELIVVVVILSIAALMAVPMLGSAADVQVRSAATRLSADLDYAKGLAVTHQQNYMVVFSPSTESYSVRDASNAVVTHPVDGKPFTVDYRADRRLSRVNLVSADFDGSADTTLTFNYLGAPLSGAVGSCSNLNTGRITLQSDHFTLYVDVEPMTGYITITQP